MNGLAGRSVRSIRLPGEPIRRRFRDGRCGECRGITSVDYRRFSTCPPAWFRKRRKIFQLGHRWVKPLDARARILPMHSEHVVE